MACEEVTLTSEMLIQLFFRWKVYQLKGFLKRRGVVLSERKPEQAEKAYFVWELKLEFAKTTRDEEDNIYFNETNWKVDRPSEFELSQTTQNIAVKNSFIQEQTYLA